MDGSKSSCPADSGLKVHSWSVSKAPQHNQRHRRLQGEELGGDVGDKSWTSQKLLTHTHWRFLTRSSAAVLESPQQAKGCLPRQRCR